MSNVATAHKVVSSWGERKRRDLQWADGGPDEKINISQSITTVPIG